MYDAGTKPENYLREYAEEFVSVEVDSTFYGTPQPERVRKWAAQVPDGFTFALKLSREVTHERRLLASRALVEEFVASASEFGDKLEAILIQMPPDFGPAEIETVEQFVDDLPAGPRWAFEVREKDWFRGAPHARLRDALGTHGVALAVTDGPFVPLDTMLHELRRPTASHAYVRWIGVRVLRQAQDDMLPPQDDMFPAQDDMFAREDDVLPRRDDMLRRQDDALLRFDELAIDRSVEIARWADAIRDVAPQLTRLAGYANNPYAGFAPGTIRMVYDALGIRHVPPARIEQTSLFE